jgi:Family of unknown function (DUF6290)
MRLSTYCNEDLAQRIKEHASQNQMNVSQMLRNLVLEELETAEDVLVYKEAMQKSTSPGMSHQEVKAMFAIE